MAAEIDRVLEQERSLVLGEHLAGSATYSAPSEDEAVNALRKHRKIDVG